MKLNIVTADPAGNITVFVLNPPENAGDRAAAVRALLADPALKAEQVGFVLDRFGSPLPRLEMMGGEFCGNAARSFGLLAARERGFRGPGELDIRVSGMEEPVQVRFDVSTGTAAVAIPSPSIRRLGFRGAFLRLYEFEGISHLVAPALPPEPVIFQEIQGIFEEDCRRRGLPLPSALGVMFWDPAASRMNPGVYVYGTGSLVFESSCGSGSAALGLYLGASLRDGSGTYVIAQPGGYIETNLEKQAGVVLNLSIGGPVALSKPFFGEWGAM